MAYRECRVLRTNLFKVDLCELSNCRDQRKSLLTRGFDSRKDYLFKWNECVCYKTVAVHFRIIWESIDAREAARVPYDCKYELLALNIKSRFCDDVISRQSPYATW
jgi:hypothetical protein